jgi:hypothetical protein
LLVDQLLPAAGATTMTPKKYSVEGGKQVTDTVVASLSDGQPYNLALHGPNGFLREFAGQFAFAFLVFDLVSSCHAHISCAPQMVCLSLSCQVWACPRCLLV